MILDVFACERHLRTDDEILAAGPDDAIARTVIVACDELLRVVTQPGFELGSAILLWDSQAIYQVAHRLQPKYFPATCSVLACLMRECHEAGNPYSFTHIGQLCSERWAALKICAEPHAMLFGDFTDDPSHWSPTKWKAYFAQRPHDRIRAPILYAMERMLGIASAAIPDVVRYNFAYDFPELQEPPAPATDASNQY
jgi:hypothetical protein